MNIKKLNYDENLEEIGVLAVSLVSEPAIEKDFMVFKKENFLEVEGIRRPMTPTQRLVHPIYGWKFWKYETRSNLPDVIEGKSRDFCIDHVGQVFHISEIRNFHQKVVRNPDYQKGWIQNSTFTQSFNGKLSRNFNLDQQMYNCRHFLKPVRDISEVISAGKEYLIDFNNFQKQTLNYDFQIQNNEKRLISGPVMIPNKLMFRKGRNGEEDYYVYFDKQTIKKFKEKFGWNRSITFQHKDEITGTSILMDSWLFGDEKDNDCGIGGLKQGSWCMTYKVVSEKLWNYIKSGEVKGFSVEILVSVDS